MMQMRTIETAAGPLALPVFMPDATRAAVRTVSAADVAACGIRCLMVNTLHLSSSPGTKRIASLGGAKKFMGWSGALASDSGGFQAWSLAKDGKLGKVTDEGIVYRADKDSGKKKLTPESCIRKQFQLGADIMFCLDQCAHPSAGRAEHEESVRRTIAWAAQCKAAFNEQCERVGGARPLLFGVIQGGDDTALRDQCINALLEIGFDGYGIGGWPVNDAGGLVDSVYHVASRLPAGTPLHGLGIGNPENIAAAYRAGYRLFDCVMPTRDARHQRLFAFNTYPPDLAGGAWYRSVNAGGKHAERDPGPVDETCDCACCARYSLAYLAYLFRAREPLAQQLATIHNLRFYARLMEALART